MLPHADLQKLADWEPIAPGFGRYDFQVFKTKAWPIFNGLSEIHGVNFHLMEDGGLGNYASAFVYPGPKQHGEINGLFIGLSLLAPLAALARSSAFIDENSFAFTLPEPDGILEKQHLVSDFEKTAFTAIESGGYRLISRAEATAPLPEGIEPYEYCRNTPPWNRFFHLLFSDTD